MFTRFYTTRMSGNKKVLQTRFEQIRNRRKSRTAKAVCAAMAVTGLVCTMLFATLVMASSMTWGNAEVTINAKTYSMQVVHIANERYLPNDSYYIPLRDVFTALGCTVNYDVDRTNIPGPFQTAAATETFPDYDWRANMVTDDITAQIYGATTGASTNMPVIEITTPSGEREYCQLGAELSSFAWSPPPVLLEGKTYIPIRALAYFVGGDSNVQWNDQTHDTYYVGKLTWDSSANTLVIDHNASPMFERYLNTIADLNTNGRRVMQRVENDRYVFCLTDGYTDAQHETLLAVDKHTGTAVKLDDIDMSLSHRLRLAFDGDRTGAIVLNLLVFDENGEGVLQHYRTYTVTQ